MTTVDLVDIAKAVVRAVVSRALQGQFVPGLSWRRDPDAGDEGLVRFAVDGDATGAVTLLDLPVEVQEAILNGAEIILRGRMTLQLDAAEMESLRGTTGRPPAAAADDSLVGAYRHGLSLTSRSVDDLEDQVVALVRELLRSLAVDLEAGGIEVSSSMPAIEAVVDPQLAALRGRMDRRRGTLARLEGELATVGSLSPERAAAELERILGEEYGVTSEAQTDAAAFEQAVRLVLRAAAERFGS